MPVNIENVTIADLAAILPPDEPDDVRDDPVAALQLRRAYYDRALVRIGSVSEIYDAWRGRLDLFRPPERRETLRELVALSRQRLRRDRLVLDRAALDRRAALIGVVKAALDR